MKTGSAWIWLWPVVYGTRSNIFIALMWRINRTAVPHILSSRIMKMLTPNAFPFPLFQEQGRHLQSYYVWSLAHLFKMALISEMFSLSPALLGVFYLCFLPLNAPFLSSKFVLSLINFTFTTESITGFDIFSEDAEISIVFVYHLPSYSWTDSDLLNEGLMPTQHDLHLKIY